MIHYFRNPKTEDLIILNLEEGELLILSRLPVRVFTEKDQRNPMSDGNDGEEQKITHKRKGRRITPEIIDKIKKMKSELKSINEIAKELSLGWITVKKYAG